MKNYKQTASDVLRLVGGEKNVVQVEHCSTRLRFTLADTSKVDAAALKKTAGVMGVISSGPQCQVVIGNDVIEVYDELLKLGTFNAGQAAAPAAPKGKKEIGGIILDYMVGIFQPLVPAIAGAGVLKALMWVTRIVILIQASFRINSIRSNPMLLVFIALFLVIAVVYSGIRYKQGVRPTVSYEFT